MTTAAAEKQVYESLFIVPPETNQTDIDGLLEKVKTTLGKSNGTLKGVQVWGRRRMAYPIKQYKDGLYIYFDFDGEETSQASVSQLFRVSDLVLRHLTVRKEEAPVRPERTEKKKEGAPAAAAPAPAPSTEKKETPPAQ